MERVYLDHNATTPLVTAAAAAMTDAATRLWGNPSSVHAEGQAARAALERARRQVAALVGAEPRQIVFTSGATEANNWVLRGAAHDGRIVTTAIEHPSVGAAAERAVAEGKASALTLVGVGPEGRVDPAALLAALDGSPVALVSVMSVNNETGARQPLREIVAACGERGVATHADVTQSVGREVVDLPALGVDVATFSAHKFGGPKGAGAIYLRASRGTPMLVYGGHQERGRRPGTENALGIIGFGAAAATAAGTLAGGEGWPALAPLRDRLWEGLQAHLPEVTVNGPDPADRAANALNVSFLGCRAESLLIALDLAGVAASAGSACSAGSLEPSHVIRAMTDDPARLDSALRFSLGPGVTPDAIDLALGRIVRCVERLRGRRG